MIKLFINADDFGISESVNRAVVECFQRGYISATTLMVNMPLCDDAVQLSHDGDFFNCVGLHLNVIEGCPLSENIKKYPIFCGDDGKFNDNINRNKIKRFCLSSDEKKALSKEFEMQIDKYFSYGFAGHVDSHQHTHYFLSYFGVLSPLLKKYKFLSVRLLSHDSNLKKTKRKVYYTIYNNLLKKKFDVKTDCFFSFDDFIKTDFIKTGIIELMSHPDYGSSGELINNFSSIKYFQDFFSSIGEYTILGFNKLDKL